MLKEFTQKVRNFATDVESRGTDDSKLIAPFNNTQIFKLKAQPTLAFFATVNQMFGGPSQLPTTAERSVIKSLCNPRNICLTVAKNAFVG